jgi:hypothetical protein
VALAGATLIAAGIAAAVVLTQTGTETRASHPGTTTSAVRSADGRIEATIYRINPFLSFGPKTEVTLRLTAAGMPQTEVSLGCTEDDDGLSIVEVKFVAADTLVVRNYNGDEQTITFDPHRLQPTETLGTC